MGYAYNQRVYDRSQPEYLEQIEKARDDKAKLREIGPRLTEYNLDYCIESYTTFHRFTRLGGFVRHENGSISNVLRCRYCVMVIQVLITFKKDKKGTMVANKKIQVVEYE